MKMTKEERKAYVYEHYSRSSLWTSTMPPRIWLCASCGDLVADAGLFRKAANQESHEANAEGNVYECGMCGSQVAVTPDIEDRFQFKWYVSEGMRLE